MEKENELIYIIEKQDLSSLKEFAKDNPKFPFNFTTDKGKNLLHYAAANLSSNTLAIIQILLEKGLNPMDVDEKFVSPLDVAKKSNNVPAMTLMKHYVNKKNQENQSYL
jgi:ankyrin repeat protein